MGLIGELKKFGKKVERETKRAFRDVEKGFEAIGDFFQGPEPPKPPPLPPPAARPEVGTGAKDQLRQRTRRRLSGQRRTLVTGDLTPDKGRRNLLG